MRERDIEYHADRGYPKRKPVTGILDVYKVYIRHCRKGYLNAMVILEEIRAKGYTGGSTILRLIMQHNCVQRAFCAVRTTNHMRR